MATKPKQFLDILLTGVGRLFRQTGAPTVATNYGAVYTKIVSGFTQLFFKNDNGTEYQITPPSSGSAYPDNVTVLSANHTLTAGEQGIVLIVAPDIQVTLPAAPADGTTYKFVTAGSFTWLLLKNADNVIPPHTQDPLVSNGIFELVSKVLTVPTDPTYYWLTRTSGTRVRDWADNINFSIGEQALDTDTGRFYKSRSNNNLNHPVSDQNYWDRDSAGLPVKVVTEDVTLTNEDQGIIEIASNDIPVTLPAAPTDGLTFLFVFQQGSGFNRFYLDAGANSITPYAGSVQKIVEFVNGPFQLTNGQTEGGNVWMVTALGSRSIREWDEEIEYLAGDQVFGPDSGTVYTSIIDENIAINPDTDDPSRSFWVPEVAGITEEFSYVRSDGPQTIGAAGSATLIWNQALIAHPGFNTTTGIFTIPIVTAGGDPAGEWEFGANAQVAVSLPDTGYSEISISVAPFGGDGDFQIGDGTLGLGFIAAHSIRTVPRPFTQGDEIRVVGANNGIASHDFYTGPAEGSNGFWGRRVG